MNQLLLQALKEKVIEPLNGLVEWDRYGAREDNSGFIFGWIKRDDGFYDFVVIDFKLVLEGLIVAYNTSSKKYSKEIGLRLSNDDGRYIECRSASELLGARLVKWQNETVSERTRRKQ